MLTLHARNVQQALPIAIDYIGRNGKPRASRNGDVLFMEEPVTTVYEHPCERVMFWPQRDANPFFHFMESLWMLNGRQDVEFVQRFAKNMASFSDDGKTFHAAYGHRWRKAFGFDQLPFIIARLKENSDDRRQMVQMWDANLDLFNQETKDLPCNTIVNFQVINGKLNMYVFNRSNDIIWGCYGANAVHFSVLQEYVASSIGIPVGKYWQISTNWHGYRATLDPLLPLGDHAPDPYRTRGIPDPYAQGEVRPYPLINTDQKTWDLDLECFMGGAVEFGYRDVFFRRVAMPLLHAHTAFKNKDIPQALEILQQCHATDWKLACEEWLLRRKK